MPPDPTSRCSTTRAQTTSLESKHQFEKARGGGGGGVLHGMSPLLGSTHLQQFRAAWAIDGTGASDLPQILALGYFLTVPSAHAYQLRNCLPVQGMAMVMKIHEQNALMLAHRMLPFSVDQDTGYRQILDAYEVLAKCSV